MRSLHAGYYTRGIIDLHLSYVYFSDGRKEVRQYHEKREPQKSRES